MTPRALRPVFAAVLLTSSGALASGFLFGENGAKALSMGGAFAGQADDLSAIQHNPAGLTQVRGYSFLVDGALLSHHVSFLRKDPDGTTQSESVQNNGGIFVLPVIGLGYGRDLAGRDFNLSLGVYGPPSVGRYTFPEPNYEKQTVNGRESFVSNPIKFASQRYALIRNDIIILFPSLSAAYEVVPERFSVGVSLQYVYSNIMFRQAVTSSLFTPRTQRDENPDFDSIAQVDQSGKPRFTAILGLMFRPSEMISVGASYRPPVPIETTGTMDVQLGTIPRQLAQVSGDQATFSMTLPQELKLGVHVKPMQALGINADLVYQGWQSIQEFVLEPQDITIAMGGAEPEPLAAIHIPKKWHHAFSGRVGAEYAFNFGLTARAGVLYEQGAIPDEYFSVDFAHPTRVFLTGGVQYAVGPVDLLLSGAFTPYQQKDITSSEVRQANTDPNVQGSVIGNGSYVTGGWVASLGIRGQFGGQQ